MRPYLFAAPLACAIALAACGKGASEPETVKVALDDAAPTPAATALIAPVNDYGATPMEQRVAVLGLLNKRNNVSEEITLNPGETREIGPVIVRVSACDRTAPWEMPQEAGAFVQIDIRERGQGQHRRVFSGWLFRDSPSLNVVEHPVYDVWVKDCTMAFPGEEGSAAAAPAAAGKSAPRPPIPSVPQTSAPVVPAA